MLKPSELWQVLTVTSWPLSLYLRAAAGEQAVCCGVLDHFGKQAHAHLLFDVRLVRAHRLDRQLQAVGNFSNGLAVDEQEKYFELAVGQLLVQYMLIGCHDVQHERLGNFGADAGTA